MGVWAYLAPINRPLPTAREIPIILKFGFLASAAADAEADMLALTVALAEIEDDIVM